MLDYFRRSVWEVLQKALAADPYVTLSTCGPSGLQAGRFRSRVGPGCLYLHVPVSADLLMNVSNGGMALVTATGWQVHGSARVVDLPGNRSGAPAPGWALLELHVARYERMDPESWIALDTIEMES